MAWAAVRRTATCVGGGPHEQGRLPGHSHEGAPRRGVVVVNDRVGRDGERGPERNTKGKPSFAVREKLCRAFSIGRTAKAFFAVRFP
jgi:hypothetical protein